MPAASNPRLGRWTWGGPGAVPVYGPLVVPTGVSVCMERLGEDFWEARDDGFSTDSEASCFYAC